MYLYFVYCILIEYMKYIDVIYLHLVRCILIVVYKQGGREGGDQETEKQVDRPPQPESGIFIFYVSFDSIS